jgi:hypothetical protein
VCPSLLGVIVKLSDLQTMANQSDVVFHGYVGEQHVDYDSMGRIVTLSEIEVVDPLYGVKSGQVYTIYQVGGELNRVVQPLLGGQTYNIGQELILFGLLVKNNLRDTIVSFGVGQGKLDIMPSANTNGDSVVEDLGNISALLPSTSASLSVSAPVPLSFSSTDVLKDEIRLMLKHRL